MGHSGRKGGSGLPVSRRYQRCWNRFTRIRRRKPGPSRSVPSPSFIRSTRPDPAPCPPGPGSAPIARFPTLWRWSSGSGGSGRTGSLRLSSSWSAPQGYRSIPTILRILQEDRIPRISQTRDRPAPGAGGSALFRASPIGHRVRPGAAPAPAAREPVAPGRPCLRVRHRLHLAPPRAGDRPPLYPPAVSRRQREGRAKPPHRRRGV